MTALILLIECGPHSISKNTLFKRKGHSHDPR
nr:MAG TPA: hypothetical protein [Bacteriophage sp.]